MILPPSELIKQPEGKTLEFKRDLSSPKNILKTIVAFANTALALRTVQERFSGYQTLLTRRSVFAALLPIILNRGLYLMLI